RAARRRRGAGVRAARTAGERARGHAGRLPATLATLATLAAVPRHRNHMPAMPRPSDGHRRLAALGGDWAGEEVLHALPPVQPTEGRAVGRFRSRVVAGGFFLVVDYAQSQVDAVLFEGHGVYGYDATAGG